MSNEVGGIAAEELKSFVTRIEDLEFEKSQTAELIRDAYKAAKDKGFDSKILRAIIRERKEDATKREEREVLLDTYRHALGMLAELPLGKAALRRVA